MGDMYVGNSRINLSYEGRMKDAYNSGWIHLGVDSTTDTKFFMVKPCNNEELRKQDEIRNMSSRGHYKSLLVPLTAAKHGDFIIIGYIFECSLKDWLKSRKVLPLFLGKNWIMLEWWRNQIMDILYTVQMMHKDFLYHGGLSEVSNYVIRNGSVSIVKAKHPSGSYNAQLEKNDVRDVGIFFRDLFSLVNTSSQHTSSDWDNFLAGFNNYGIIYLKKHPVLYDAAARFDYLRALIGRIRWQWELNQEDWTYFKEHIESYSKICPNWYQQIDDNSVYKEQYDKDHRIYKLDSNQSMLVYVENAMKHALEQGLRSARIEMDLNRMFPGLSSRVHSTCAKFSSDWPHVKIIPG